MAAHSSRIQGPDGGAASTAVTRRVRTALWQGRRGRGAAVSRAGAADLSLLARSDSPCRTLSGGRTTACRQDAAGLRRPHVQPILDGAVRSRSADVTGALTPTDVIQILLETPASRPAIAKLIGRIHENDNLAQIAARKFGGDNRGAQPRRQARSRPGRANPHRRHL